MEYSPNRKGIMAPMEYIPMVPWFVALTEKSCFYESLFFEMVMVMVKDYKKYRIKYTMSIKISFMHYMKWTRVMLPVVSEKFELVSIFLLFFLFTIIVNGKDARKVTENHHQLGNILIK